MSHACDSCGKPATCVGQFDGSCTPTYACDACCDHEEDEDGECEPMEFEEEFKPSPTWPDGTPVKIATRRDPKIDPETGEQAKDPETGELLFEPPKIDMVRTILANPETAERLVSTAGDIFKRILKKSTEEKPVSDLEEALVRLRSMADRPLPPIPAYDREAAEQINLARQYQEDLRLVLVELDRLRKLVSH